MSASFFCGKVWIRSDPEVIKHFSCSIQLNETSIAHENLNAETYRHFLFLAFKLSDIIFFLLINVKMPTIVGIFNIYEQDKFHTQLS